MTKRILFYIAFFLCAATSTFVFNLGDDYIFITGLFPGLLFILTTILCAHFVTTLTFLPTIKFALWSYLIYAVIFYLTLFSSYVALFVGIVTGGLGSLSLFALFSNFIKPINYSKKTILGLGALAFLINAVIIFTPIRYIAPDFFRRDMSGNFCATFFIWQYIIGVKLANQITADK
jgi:hypothetical protein